VKLRDVHGGSLVGRLEHLSTMSAADFDSIILTTEAPLGGPSQPTVWHIQSVKNMGEDLCVNRSPLSASAAPGGS